MRREPADVFHYSSMFDLCKECIRFILDIKH